MIHIVKREIVGAMSTTPNSKRQRRVHFTHHPCVVYGLWKPQDPDAPRRTDILYICGRNPNLTACGYRSRAHKGPHAFTIEPDATTCSYCRRYLAENTEAAWKARAKEASSECLSVRESNVRFWSNWLDDQELTVRAWLSCCRNFGAPWPFSERERINVERWYRAIQLKRAFGGIQLWQSLSGMTEPDSLVAKFEAKLAEIDAADRALVGPLLEQARVVDRQLIEATNGLRTIQSFVDDLAARVRSRALVSIPEVN